MTWVLMAFPGDRTPAGRRILMRPSRANDKDFVTVRGSRDGIGRLVGADESSAEVEYFVSPAGPEFCRRRVSCDRVIPVHLSPQTRVYVHSSDGAKWVGGRITGGPFDPKALPPSSGVKEEHYEIQFPNKTRNLLASSKIHVRWARPISNPSDHLAARITETPFFYDARSRLVRYLAHQRAAFGGVTALASSAVEFIEHQVTAVRHILADPIQRYLLADEVGLGKTIEAGILMRQHAIDAPYKARILVVVPRHLRVQWKDELRRKFFLDDEHVTVIGDDELGDSVTDDAGLEYTMLVVDEAHQIALRAFASTEAARRPFDRVRRLAMAVPRVLLLSGTPVLHQEDGFLAMLHLLDPDAYRLNERDSFRRQVQNRQVIADAIADLSDDADGLFAEEALAALEGPFSDDLRLMDLIPEVRSRLNDSPEDQLRKDSLRALRVHLIETYRLHRRMIRTRRDDPRLTMHLPRRLGWAVINDDDQARKEASDFLDAWRFEASARPSCEGSGSAYRGLFAHWVDCALSHPKLLIRALHERLVALEAVGPKKRGPAARGRKKRSESAAFATEVELVRTRLGILETAVREDGRVSALANWLSTNPTIKMAVVFVDDEAVADEVAAELTARLGSRRVVRLRSVVEINRETRDMPEAGVLVCDASGEEGLNLQQYGAVLVHYDLPLAPTRIEQRIGRIDRLEARKDTRNVVCLSSVSYEAEWAECLCNGTRVFERSIAPLQYLLAELTTRIREELLENGREAFSTCMKKMVHPQHGLDAESRRVRAQEALDAFEGDPQADRTIFNALENADWVAEDEGPAALDGWVVDRLQFKKRACERDVFRYVYSRDGPPTLVPVRDLIERFRLSLDLQPRARQCNSEAPLWKCTFSRAVSELNAVRLLRVGHQFVDGIASYIRADDRGSVFALWRCAPGLNLDVPQLYFRYDYVIEADISGALRLLDLRRMSPEALRRRAEDAFPVQYHRVWLSADLERVEDPALLTVLERPYSKSPRGDGSRDVNLQGDRWAAIDAMGCWQEWETLCVRSSETALRLTREQPELTSSCLLQASRLRTLTATKVAALEARLSRLEGSCREAERFAVRFEGALGEALARGVETPLVICDSCGAVFIGSTALP